MNTLETFKRITNNVFKYAQGGASFREHDGWSITSGRKKVRFHGEKKELERLAKQDDVVVYGNLRLSFEIIYVDVDTDTEYRVSYEHASHIGDPEYIYAYVTENVTVADSEETIY